MDGDAIAYAIRALVIAMLILGAATAAFVVGGLWLFAGGGAVTWHLPTWAILTASIVGGGALVLAWSWVVKEIFG